MHSLFVANSSPIGLLLYGYIRMPTTLHGISSKQRQDSEPEQKDLASPKSFLTGKLPVFVVVMSIYLTKATGGRKEGFIFFYILRVQSFIMRIHSGDDCS